MKNKYLLIVFGLCLSLFTVSCGNDHENSWQIDSPNKSIRIIVQKDTESNLNGLFYTVLLKNDDSYEVFMDNSQLGI
jgi:hypothetical protein